ncbi:MAG: DUF4465 domain-containing protein [Spirochaetota bacterium]
MKAFNKLFGLGNIAVTLALCIVLPLVSCDYMEDETEDDSGRPTSVITFEDLTVPEQGYWNGSDDSGEFTVAEVTFMNSYSYYEDWDMESWNGVAYSTLTDTATEGFENQYSVIAGEGYNGSDVFAIASPLQETDSVMEFSEPKEVQCMYVCNTTYAYLSMKNGDGFAKKFGGETGDDEDYFLLTVRGYDSEGNPTGSTGFYLADYRFLDNTQDYIIRDWTRVDLTGLGDNVKTISFELTSSDTGDSGMNTPAYVAFDNVTYYK